MEEILKDKVQITLTISKDLKKRMDRLTLSDKYYDTKKEALKALVFKKGLEELEKNN